MSLTTKKIAAVWRALKTVVQLNPSSVQALVFPLKGGGVAGGEERWGRNWFIWTKSGLSQPHFIATDNPGRDR